ncbi:MAG: tetratricopeptide repeat protein [Bacteroidota bacterium]|nr:tetratricopeptide repeat protein [Bacteroidota bacterium]MEC8248799.1 tetratricopeptide repeat protein [Bacteroidota bacterium]
MKLKKINLLLALRLLTNINLLLVGLLWSTNGHSQDETELESLSNTYVYKGNSHFNNSFLEAEKNYRMALSEMPSNTKGAYNLGNAYYNAELYDEALARLLEAARKGTKLEKHRAYHNIGNILMQDKQCKKAVEAYKNALRNDPKDEESRYNLAIAQECAKEEGGGSDDDQEEKEENQDQQKKNEEKKDSDKEQDEEEKNKDKGEEEDRSNKGEDEKKENSQPQDKGDESSDTKKPEPQAGKLSPQQIKNLLEAMNNEEKKVQEKVNASKKKGIKVKSDKDW